MNYVCIGKASIYYNKTKSSYVNALGKFGVKLLNSASTYDGMPT